ncbi:hypothetical protein LOK49_LG08G01310 [Camellia lanceoleosa]|uniref:Uncharacterized protein n=1 Tax=Camellia lanceoleosa TaxID=1840588 RepID=A0ACC0GVX4_9ERIC|nr:hypothetical protein LOK49_LG08G01310 [Camellia lanceoleosa]
MLVFRSAVEASLLALQTGLRQRAQASVAREVLELLLDMFHVVSKVEKLIKELPSVPTDWSNGDVNFAEKDLDHLSNGFSIQHTENETNIRETQSMLLDSITSLLKVGLGQQWQIVLLVHVHHVALTLLWFVYLIWFF